MAIILQDGEFKHAIIAKIIERGAHLNCTMFWLESLYISHAWYFIDEIRQFVAGAFLIGIEEDWYDTWGHKFDQNFYGGLERAAIRATSNKATHKALLEGESKGEQEVAPA